MREIRVCGGDGSLRGGKWKIYKDLFGLVKGENSKNEIMARQKGKVKRVYSHWKYSENTLFSY